MRVNSDFLTGFAGMKARGVGNLLAAFTRSASAVRSLIPSFYSYTYDLGTSSNQINDGGLDMFDVGNEVRNAIIL